MFSPHITVVVDKSNKFAFFCAIGRWSQVVDSFDLFVEGLYPNSSDPVPKIFKLSSCENVFGCIDFEATLIEAAQHFGKVGVSNAERNFLLIESIGYQCRLK
jgi:hypothetical protein